jgi:hypothetical protein
MHYFLHATTPTILNWPSPPDQPTSLLQSMSLSTSPCHASPFSSQLFGAAGDLHAALLSGGAFATLVMAARTCNKPSTILLQQAINHVASNKPSTMLLQTSHQPFCLSLAQQKHTQKKSSACTHVRNVHGHVRVHVSSEPVASQT